MVKIVYAVLDAVVVCMFYLLVRQVRKGFAWSMNEEPPKESSLAS